MLEFQLAGRDNEIEQLEGFLTQALAGNTAVCLVTGEPGAGKTSLLARFAELSIDRHPGLLVARGECDAVGESGDPYLPFREILRDLTGEKASHPAEGPVTGQSDSRLRALFRMTARTVVENGPDLIDIFVPGAALAAKIGGQAAKKIAGPRRTENATGAAIREPASITQENIFEQYVLVLKTIASRAPLVLILDDLHWADSGSAGLLFHLARRMVSDPVLIIGAYRAADVRAHRGDAPHPMKRIIAELKRIHGSIHIDLDGQDSEAFLDALVDSRPNRLGAEFRRELLEHTGGNPLFAVELIKALEASGVLKIDDDDRLALARTVDWQSVPSRIEGVIESAMERLTPEQREILDVACIQGEEFSAEVLAEVLEQSRRAVIKQLSGAFQRDLGIVSAVGLHRVADASMSLYRFRHKLFQKYLHDQLDELERASLHEEIGTALERLHAGSEAAVAVSLAYHFSRTPDWRKMARYSFLAGEGARQAFAPEEAAGFYRAALETLEQRPEGCSEAAVGLSDLAERLGDQRVLLGEFDDALDAYRKALRALTGDSHFSKCRLLTKTSVPLQRLKDYGPARSVLDDALAQLEAISAPRDAEWWRAWINVQLERAFIEYWTANTDGLNQAVEALSGPVRQWGDSVQRSQFVETLARRALRETRFRPGDDILRMVDESVASLDQTAPPALRMGGYFQLAFVSLWSDRIEQSIEAFRSCLDLYKSCGDAILRLRALVYLSVAARRQHRPELVEECLAAAAPMAEEFQAQEYRGLIAAQRAWLALIRSHVEVARSETMRALEIWDAAASRYPVKWTALWVRIALGQENGEQRAIEAAVRQMLDAPQARQTPVIEQSLREVLAASEAGDESRFGKAVSEALSAARENGFL